MDGVINLFKPKGMTSHSAVYRLRKITGIKKIGHSGTLDPNASGVLPILVGKATRIAEYLLESDKEYIGEMSLGFETDSQDIDGNILNYSDKEVSEDEIRMVMAKYKGQIDQVPPMYSAIKKDGKKLYELARQGIVVERKARNSTIYENKILSISDTKTIFYVKCSKGTYIRTLCHDIGRDLGTYGYMSFLIRVGVGPFKIEDSLSLDFLEKLPRDQVQNYMIPLDRAIECMDEVYLPDEEFSRLTNGMLVETNLEVSQRTYKIYCKGSFIGIGHVTKKDNINYIKMNKVILI